MMRSFHAQALLLGFAVFAVSALAEDRQGHGNDRVRRLPHTRIRATHYSAMKTLLRPGDVVYMTCVRGVAPRDRNARKANAGRRRPAPRFVEAKFQAALRVLNAIHDPKIDKALVFSSIEDLRNNLSRLPKDLKWVSYNTEPHITPTDELSNIQKSVKRFASIAHEAGLTVGWGPTTRMIASDEKRYLALAACVDLLGLQHQKVLQYRGVQTFVSLTRDRAKRIHKVNPKCQVVVQVVVGRGTDEQLIQALKAVAPCVDGFGIFTMREVSRAAKILRALR